MMIKHHLGHRPKARMSASSTVFDEARTSARQGTDARTRSSYQVAAAEATVSHREGIGEKRHAHDRTDEDIVQAPCTQELHAGDAPK